MDTVNKIRHDEDALLALMPNGGHFTERTTYLRAHGIYAGWRALYKRYVLLATTGDIEALKRAVFYAWYEQAEPAPLSGLYELPDDETRCLVSVMESFLAGGNDDPEFAYMLPHYSNIASFYLDRFEPIPHIRKASCKRGTTLKIVRSTEYTWDERGQMGAYWKSVSRSIAGQTS